tara:strand:+ start:21837 stop:23003 length:1167 start_codon:yes stop_codon:yes gene_type:complete
MQLENHIQGLLKKFILNQCSSGEVEEVVSYFQNITKSNQLPTVEDVLILLEEKPVLAEADANRIHDDIINSVQKDPKRTSKQTSHIWKYAVAASVALLISIGFIFNKNNKEPLTKPITTNIIKAGTDKATLTLGDGSQITLEKGNSFQTKNANSNGEKIIYEAEKQKTTEIAYNYLTIPRGGQFQITLSDGTQIWLNSESQLKYPESFISGETRIVELLYGEAYFDVSPSTEHKGAKFKVINQSQEIEVFGTEFNIKAYKGESNIYTTLVEGKVSVSSSTTNQTLKPSQQANLNLNDNTMAIANVNVYNEISWREGVFSFRKKPLIEIMQVLSRWYDIEFEFVKPEIKNQGFNGVLSKDQNIEDILKTIKNFGVIKDYEIKNKKVILK